MYRKGSKIFYIVLILAFIVLFLYLIWNTGRITEPMYFKLAMYFSPNPKFDIYSNQTHLATNGKFYSSFIFSGNTLTNVSLACNLGNKPIVFTNISSLGPNLPNNTLPSGSILEINGLQCYNESGAPLVLASNLQTGPGGNINSSLGPNIFINSDGNITKLLVTNIKESDIYNLG